MKKQNRPSIVEKVVIVISVVLFFCILAFSINHYIYGDNDNYKIYKTECRNETEVVGMMNNGSLITKCQFTITSMYGSKHCASNYDLEKYPCNSSYCRYFGEHYLYEIIKEDYIESVNLEVPITKTHQVCEDKEVKYIPLTNDAGFSNEQIIKILNDFDGTKVIRNIQIFSNVQMKTIHPNQKWLEANCECIKMSCTGICEEKYLTCLDYKCGDYKAVLK